MGIFDGIEVVVGSDPNDPLSLPALPALPAWLPMTLALLVVATSLVAHARQRRATQGRGRSG